MTTSTSTMSSSRPGRSPAAGMLERIVLAVPDPEATATFLSSGLDLAIDERDGQYLAVCEGEYQADRGQGAILLVPGPETTVERLVLAIPDEADLDEVVRMVGGRRTGDGELEVVEPVTEIPVVLQTTGTLKVAPPEPAALRPRRMGHVNLKSPGPSQTARFFTDSLGLRLSEYIGENLYWLRTGTEHHNVALRPGGPRSVHHLGFEVAGWHAYQPILDQLDRRGYKIEYGPGRHRPGRSLFVYLCDPNSGLRVELFADMAHITDPLAAPIAWEAGDRMTKTLNTWGPLPPQSFLD